KVKHLKQVAKHLIRKKLLVGTGSLLIANIIPVLIFLVLCTLLLAIIGALSGSVDQDNDQGDDGGGGYICSPTGELDKEDWDSYFKHKDRSRVLQGYGDDIIDLYEEIGIDPVLVGPMALHETGYGASSEVVDKNIPGGLTDRATGWQTLQHYPALKNSLE